MTAPLYVSPEQWYQDKAEYARKGIARGKPIVALEYAGGIMLMGENRSASLRKISEIYDRIAFAAVGKFDEYENLRKAGIRYADLRGYSYCRDDVMAKSLANEYSTVLGSIFTREMKPFEVELLVAEVGETQNALYQILYDGSVNDHERYASIGGDADKICGVLRESWSEEMKLDEAVKLSRKSLLAANGGVGELNEQSLEVAVLERAREGRKFRKLGTDEIRELLSG
ncbi:MAG: proteasome subunit alpha [Myxococcota bacterium]